MFSQMITDMSEWDWSKLAGKSRQNVFSFSVMVFLADLVTNHRDSFR